MSIKDGDSRGRCSRCLKQTYSSRKDARIAAKRTFPGERMNAYRCPWVDAAWHFGHIAPEVISGEIRKNQFYGPRGVGSVRTAQGTRKPIKRKGVAA